MVHQVHLVAVFAQYVFFDTCDGTLQSLDATQEVDDDDEENHCNSCQSDHDNHFPKSLFSIMCSATSFNSLTLISCYVLDVD